MIPQCFTITGRVLCRYEVSSVRAWAELQFEVAVVHVERPLLDAKYPVWIPLIVRRCGPTRATVVRYLDNDYPDDA